MSKSKFKQEFSADERQFLALADLMPQLVWMAHADGHIFWYNRRWYEYTGTTAEQMEGWGWQSVHDPAELPNVLDRWRMSIKTGQPFDMEFPLRSASGKFRWFLTRIVPVRDADGNVIRWVGTNTDVDDLRQTREALRLSESRLRLSEEHLRLTQKAAKIASWELDLQTEEYVWSEEAFEIMGQSSVNFRPTHGNLLTMMYFSTDRENAVRALRSAATKNKEYDTQFRILRPDQETRWISARGKAFYNSGQNVMIGVFIDITDAQKAMVKTEKSDGGGTNPVVQNKRAQLRGAF